MAAPIRRFVMAWKALRQLGLRPVMENGLYQLGLRFNRWNVTPPDPQEKFELHLEAIPPILTSRGDAPDPQALADANLLLQGQVRLYGGEPVPLVLDPGGPLQSWVELERSHAAIATGDIKDIWEPARFCWAIPLARAFEWTKDSRYSEVFWQAFETFGSANPAYLGPNWTSGQEAAIRIMTWTFVLRAFASAPESTPERLAQLVYSIAAHAQRIPPTLLYARSQRNNHLLSEAAGLYTAGVLLGKQELSQKWRLMGWTIFNQAILDQFEPDGAYIQQSTNYHRLALQEALWVDALARHNKEAWPTASRERLAAATRWLLARVDPISGQAPNFGHQDGAYLFPFGDHGDERPVAQAAARAFLGAPAFAPGNWNAFSTWLGCVENREHLQPKTISLVTSSQARNSSGVILRSDVGSAILRANRFHYRPGQSDQLHLDFWYQGVNVALDAGTYRYNAPAPWDNALASAFVHNSVTIDSIEPMTRAGRFLWLDWDQAQVVDLRPGQVIAERMGYEKLGLRHRRSLIQLGETGWLVEDLILPTGTQNSVHTSVLNWLLPDWPWNLKGGALDLEGPDFKLTVTISASVVPSIQLIRAGELLVGTGPFPSVAGWVSETYAARHPALAFRTIAASKAPLNFSTSFSFRSLDNPSGVR